METWIRGKPLMSYKLSVKKLSTDAILPRKANETDAGWDLFSSVDFIVPPNSRLLVKTDISIASPSGAVGLIWPRSGLAVKKGISVMAGVIDSGYRGEVKVCLYNTSGIHQEFRKHDKIAQILIQPLVPCVMVEVEQLDDTDRGDKGFGSSDSAQ